MKDDQLNIFPGTEVPSRLRVNWEVMLEEIRESRENFKKVVEEIKESNKANADLKQSLSAIMQETAENEKTETEEKQNWLDKFVSGESSALEKSLNNYTNYYKKGRKEQSKEIDMERAA